MQGHVAIDTFTVNFILQEIITGRKKYMRKLNFLFAFLLFGNFFSAQVMWQFNAGGVVTWTYEWGDEFNENTLDKEKWSTGEGSSHTIFTNKEQEYYTDNGNNHLLKNGTLSILAKKESVVGKAVDWMRDTDSLRDNETFLGFNKHTFQYTSGKIDSRRLFNKGFFEIRFKAPAERGMWPAFWLYGGDPNEEIDIFELKGEKSSKVHVDTHCANKCDFFKNWYGKKLDWGGWLSLDAQLSEGFNSMAGEWENDYIKIYLNGKCIAYVPVSFNIPKTVEANVAIPSDNGPFHPGPAANFVQSTPFEIDYIRVWTKSNATAQNRISKPDAGERTTLSNLITGKASLKKKNKFMYGKKSAHADEGAFVSLFPGEGRTYLLYLNGIKQNQSVTVKLKNISGNYVFTSDNREFQNKLDFSALPAGDYTLEISCDGKTVQQALQL
jgi:beta-glucanase (GH16 family)